MPESEHDGKVTRWPHNRAKQIQIEGGRIRLPPFTEGDYLLEALKMAGPTRHLEMGGEMALSWADILAFEAATGRISSAWEREALREMSQAYLEGKLEGKSPLSISPLDQSEHEDD